MASARRETTPTGKRSSSLSAASSAASSSSRSASAIRYCFSSSAIRFGVLHSPWCASGNVQSSVLTQYPCSLTFPPWPDNRHPNLPRNFSFSTSAAVPLPRDVAIGARNHALVVSGKPIVADESAGHLRTVRIVPPALEGCHRLQLCQQRPRLQRSILGQQLPSALG